jgi:hypothetical protein
MLCLLPGMLRLRRCGASEFRRGRMLGIAFILCVRSSVPRDRPRNCDLRMRCGIRLRMGLNMRLT